MWALGDKIASTIVAQTLQIPTLPWSGSGKGPQATHGAASAHAAHVNRGGGRVCVLTLSFTNLRLLNTPHSCIVDNLENKYDTCRKEIEIVYNPMAPG